MAVNDDSLGRYVSSTFYVVLLTIVGMLLNIFTADKSGTKITVLILQVNHEYYRTVVIAIENLSNSEAKPRCYDNFEGNNNRAVFFLSTPFLSFVCFRSQKSTDRIYSVPKHSTRAWGA